jgi:hypothetical protein
MTKIIPGDVNTAVPALRELQKGQKVIYHTGFLAVDRSQPGDQKQKMFSQAVGFIGDTALNLSDAGRVFLTQRKLGPGNFEYIATGA